MQKSTLHSLCVFAIMTALSFVVLFFISPDSPTHYFYDRCDSANFFMCGKAWMNGMIPYVDFTDSKGPLLWLLYGIGYLLSPRSYTGVLAVSVVAYAFTYFYTYRTASLFLSHRAMAWLATVLMTLVFFCPLYHYETRAEDFCLPFVMLSLYHTCQVLYGQQPPGNPVMRRASFILGLCMGATLLIKFTVAAMLAVFVPFLWAAFHAARQSVWQSLLWMLAGGLTAILPFIAVFLVEGNLTAFIDQYFFITFRTVQKLQSSNEGVLHNLTLSVMQNIPTLLLFVTAAASPLLFPTLPRMRYFPLLAVVFFCIVCMPNARWPYYFSVASPFVLFAVVALAQMLERYCPMRPGRLLTAATVVTIVATILCNYHYYYYSIHSVGNLNLKTQKDNPVRQAYQYYSNVISSYPRQPRIIYADTQCMSEYGVAAEALPGCRDWSLQNGATPQMKQATWDAIRQRRADFVVVATPESASRLRALGYQQVPADHITSDHLLFQRTGHDTE